MATNGYSYLTTGANFANLESELASFRSSDTRREEFVQSLVSYLQDLETRHREIYSDYENEKEGRRAWQEKARAYEHENTRLSQAMGNSCFTLALIDGDGAIFQDNLFAAAADGGSDAAHKLTTEIKNHLQIIDPSSSQLPLMVQIYTNLDGLSKKLYNCGIIKTGQDLYSFVRSFNMNQPLFNIIDVGAGKERADHKLRETLRLFITNQQCKHIILGGISHDNGYIPTLSPLKHDLATASRISLLETSPSEAGYVGLGFRSFKCPTTFRSEHLPNKPAPAPAPQRTTTYPQAPSQSPQTMFQQPVSIVQVPAAQTSPSSYQPPSSPTPPSSGASPAPATRLPVNRTLSTSSGVPLSSDNDSNSWATVGKSGATQKNISIAPTPKKERPHVVLNKEEERLDPPINKSKADFPNLQDRIKKGGKLCNYFHILGRCQDAYCEYKHEPRIPQAEQVALRMKARQKSCHYMGDCRDVNCINGHVCPYGINCKFEECFFAGTHDLDRNPAHRWYEDGSLEPFRPAVAG